MFLSNIKCPKCIFTVIKAMLQDQHNLSNTGSPLTTRTGTLHMHGNQRTLNLPRHCSRHPARSTPLAPLQALVLALAASSA